MTTESKWISFVQIKDTGETRVYAILTKEDDPFVLGLIKWYPGWRCYCFFPSTNTVFEKQCLQDITDFIKKLMDERKNNQSRITNHQLPLS